MGNNDGVNPAWKPMLDKIPVELQELVIPIFKEWDQGVQAQFAKIREESGGLEAYKPFKDNNIDPAYIEQAVMLADQLQRDPQAVISRVNEAWKLGFVSPEEAAKLGQSVSPPKETEESDLEFDSDTDIFKDPRVAAMKQALDELQNNFQTEKQREEEEAQLQEFEDYIDGLEKQYTDPSREGGPLPFNRMFVTALISNGLDGDEAVKQYHQALAEQVVNPNQQNEPPANANSSGQEPPVVMGGEGSTGSGSPDGSVDFGSMSQSDLKSTVQDLLAKSLDSGQ